MGDLLKGTGWGAIAMAVAAMTLPVQASAQSSAWLRVGEPAQASLQQQSGEWGGGFQNRSPEYRAEQRANRAEQRANRAEQRADRIRNGDTWQSQDDQTWRDRNRNESDGWRNRDGNRTYSDANRWRDSNNDRNWRDNNRWRDKYRNRWSDNHRKWDRRWRDNNRYNWYQYRQTNRNHYRIGRYYAPYYGYSYRRLGIGFWLASLFYSDHYWINDPWQYRLPKAYGPHRWVRYYDDVLLVNTYTGEVVDVIYNFFW
ncbi:MAG: hypothetical protein FJX31_02435 [Alphaproteobacteria bacterium]|nr:hypothetical protein [Alphaproteobacteria bacterium]